MKLSGEGSGAYLSLSVEKYGGMICYSWLDRPLSLAGRVLLRTDSGVESRLFELPESLVIPSVAIHMNRNVNEGYAFNPARDMLPLYGMSADKGALNKRIAEALGKDEADILSHDLFLYVKDEPTTFGVDEKFILTPRYDDLGCVYASLEAFLSAKDAKSTSVYAIFDNEEVGSETKQGAASDLLYRVLSKIAGSADSLDRMTASGLLVSADNAHAVHPNHPELADKDNAPILTGGVVVKYNANQAYTTDAVSDAIFREIAKRAGAKLQRFSNRADMRGGSTLGSIADTVVSIPSVDIGLPQLAMHSANETAAVSDLFDMIKILTEFYSASLVSSGDATDII